VSSNWHQSNFDLEISQKLCHALEQHSKVVSFLLRLCRVDCSVVGVCMMALFEYFGNFCSQQQVVTYHMHYLVV